MSQLERATTTAVLLLALLGLGGALAQDQAAPEAPSQPPPLLEEDSLQPAARESLREARALAEEALDTYIEHYPDQELWRQAIALGREARRQAPEAIEPLRFLAEVYTITHWYGPAWETWMDYLDAGGELDRTVERAIAQVGNELGFINYEQGQTEEALRYYRQVIDLAPDNVQAYSWVGRILLETERPAQAIPYWQTVVERQPGDEGAAYFLELAQDQAEWGTGAVNAFREGVAFYEDGELDRARERFARATSLNPDYAQAWAWLGRVAFEQGNYQEAETYYGRAADLEPGNDTYSYFFEEAQRRQESQPPRAQEGTGEQEADEPGTEAQGTQEETDTNQE